MQDVEARIQGEEERAARNARRRERQRRQRLQERRQFLRHALSAPAMGVSCYNSSCMLMRLWIQSFSGRY